MRKLTVFVAVLAVLVMAAVPALAEYGEWEKIYDPLYMYPPGLSNAAVMGVAVGDVDSVYSVGMYQSGALTIENAWASHDGGQSFETISAMDMGYMPNECYMLMIMNMYLQVASTGGDNVQLFGFGVDEQCLEQYEFPACLFVCMLQIQPLLKYSNDGGENWTMATVNGANATTMTTAADYADDTVGYVVGGPRFIARTQDGGVMWNRIFAPGDGETYFNDVDFITPEYGFVITGESEEEPEAKDGLTPAEAREWYDRAVHRVNYIKDPVYRLQYKSEHPDKGKYTNGKIYRTIDGGQNWEEVLSELNDGFMYIHAVDEDTIWVIGDPHVYTTHPYSLWLTEDGGDTWNDVTSRVPQPNIPGAPSYALGAISFQPSGQIDFLGGAAGNSFSYKSLIMFTEDSGQTWEVEPDVVPWGHPVLGFDWGSNKMAYAAAFDLSIYKYAQANDPPVAIITGDDLFVDEGDMVGVDGSESYDIDDDPITFEWAADGVTFADATAETTSFTAPGGGEYMVTLTVSDGTDTDTDQIMVTVAGEGDDDDVTPDDDDDSVNPDDDDDDDDDDDAADDDDDDDDDDDSGSCGC
jgi:K319-like protein